MPRYGGALQAVGQAFHRPLWRKMGSFGSICERRVPESPTRRNSSFVHARYVEKSAGRAPIHKSGTGNGRPCPRKTECNSSVHGPCIFFVAFMKEKLSPRSNSSGEIWAGAMNGSCGNFRERIGTQKELLASKGFTARQFSFVHAQDVGPPGPDNPNAIFIPRFDRGGFWPNTQLPFSAKTTPTRHTTHDCIP